MLGYVWGGAELCQASLKMVVENAVLFSAIRELPERVGCHSDSAPMNPWTWAEAHGEVKFAASSGRGRWHGSCVLGQWSSHLGTKFQPVSVVESAWRRLVKKVWMSDVRNVPKLFARLELAKGP